MASVRITVVGPTHPFKGGVAQHTTVLARELIQRGHQVLVENWARQYPARLYPGQLAVEAPEFPLYGLARRSLSWNRPDSWWRVGRSARTKDLMVLAHVNVVQVPAYRVVLAAARGVRKKVVIAHNVLPHERSRIDRLMVRSLFDAADEIVTHSEAEQELARSLTDVPVVMVPLAPHLPADFVPARPRPGEHRRLLFFGLIRPYKGLDVLLRALAIGPQDVRLRVVGEFWGGTEPTEALVAELGLTDRVELRPGYARADTVPDLFADVDALVLPHRTATGSQGVMMAFQFGVPVLASDAGNLCESVTVGVDGLVAEPGSVSSLAQNIGEFYRPGIAERLRAAVRPIDPVLYWDRYVDVLLRTRDSMVAPRCGVAHQPPNLPERSPP